MRIRTVLARFRPDRVLSLASARDFLLGPGRPLEDRAFRALAPTPYCVDARRRRVLFVVVDRPEELAAETFFNQGQLKRARAVVSVSFDEMERLADPGSLDRPVVIYNTGRCGSTVLLRLLDRAEDTVSVSEPDLDGGLIGAGLEPSLAGALFARCMAALAAGLGASGRRLVIKLRGYGPRPDGFIRRGLPDARRVFLYRNGLRTVASGMRAFASRSRLLALFDGLARRRPLRPAVAAAVRLGRGGGARLNPYLRRVEPRAVARAGGAGLLAVNWVSAIDGALNLQRSESPLAAFAYEDMVAAPRRWLDAVLDVTELKMRPDALDAAVRAIDERRDPHAGGALDPGRQRAWTPTAERERAVREILVSHPSIDAPGLRLPGTRATASASDDSE